MRPFDVNELKLKLQPRCETRLSFSSFKLCLGKCPKEKLSFGQKSDCFNQLFDGFLRLKSGPRVQLGCREVELREIRGSQK